MHRDLLPFLGQSEAEVLSGREIPDGEGVRQRAGHDCTRIPPVTGIFRDGRGLDRPQTPQQLKVAQSRGT